MKRYTRLFVALALTALAVVAFRYGGIAVAQRAADNPFGTDSEADPYGGVSNPFADYGDLPVPAEPATEFATEQEAKAAALRSHAETLFRQGYITANQMKAIESQILRERAEAQRQLAEATADPYAVELEPRPAEGDPTDLSFDAPSQYRELKRATESERQRLLQELEVARQAAQLADATASEPEVLDDTGTASLQLSVDTTASECRIIAQKLAQARQIAQHARTEPQKSRAKQILHEALDKYFDVDMKVRRVDLEKIKKRVAEMEVQLEKRATAKAQIVDLQLQTFVNEAEGLGFFSGGDRNPLDHSDLTNSPSIDEGGFDAADAYPPARATN